MLFMTIWESQYGITPFNISLIQFIWHISIGAATYNYAQASSVLYLMFIVSVKLTETEG